MEYAPKESASHLSGLLPPTPATSPRAVVATSGFGIAWAAAIGYVLGGPHDGYISMFTAVIAITVSLILGIALGYLMQSVRANQFKTDNAQLAADRCEHNLEAQLKLLSSSCGSKELNSIARSHALALETDLASVGLGWLAGHLADAVDPMGARDAPPYSSLDPELIFRYTQDLLSAEPSCSSIIGRLARPEGDGEITRAFDRPTHLKPE